jgi:predicted dehydrogenase/threonine dehydrogenase-like Zn-dependent dehydrogenase
VKQLLQNLRDGSFDLLETPTPSRPPGFVLVANRASLISAGTERSTVQAAQASLLGKARQRPDKVRQVLDNLRKEGLWATVQKVQEKLNLPKALGYSSAGTVLEADAGAPLRAGDRVACAGQDYASHAEVVVVPRNLVVPLPERLSFDEGAFAALGAIALQGIRRAGVSTGDRVLVIGLGLLGQLTWQLLEDSGCLVVGTDVSAGAVERSRALGLEHAVPRGADVGALCRSLSDGHGVDAVIVTASARTSDPLELAADAARERARVVIVGILPLEVPREVFYRKELDLVMSRSYGPGRYDPEYEEGGVDYPYAYARWTEGRNMAAFLEAVARDGVKLQPLISHRFPIERAFEAYEIVSGRRVEPHLGIVLQYAETTKPLPRLVLRHTDARATPGRLRLGLVGAGSFARGYLLPHLKGNPAVELITVATAHGHTAQDAARKFGFAESSTDSESLVSDERIDAVFVATRHDRHAPLSRLALENGKHVFVEKPLAVSPEQLSDLLPTLSAARGVLQVGFNRRFSPLAVALKRGLAGSSAPTQITYRVNAGPLPADHWLVDPVQGGGRMVGEGCHFLDLMQYLTDERPIRVSALSFGGDALGATSLIVELSGGSCGTLVYQANSSPRIAKERIEVSRAGRAGIIDDWRRLELYDGRRKTVSRVRGQAKGHAEEIVAFLAAVASGKPAIPIESQVLTTAAVFAALRSIATRETVTVEV